MFPGACLVTGLSLLWNNRSAVKSNVQGSRKMKITNLLFAAIALGLATGASGQMKPEDQIKFRKAGYSFMSWNMGKLKGQLIDNPASFNKDQVAAAANLIAATANSGMGALFGAGTEKDAGSQKTRVKAEFFQQPDEVKKLAGAFVKEANDLQKVAATGDAAAIKVQFGKTGESCKACHDKFRKDD
jgi:cytochrome c556